MHLQCVHAEVNITHCWYIHTYTCVSCAEELTDFVKQWKDVPVFVVGKATAAAGIYKCNVYTACNYALTPQLKHLVWKALVQPVAMLSCLWRR